MTPTASPSPATTTSPGPSTTILPTALPLLLSVVALRPAGAVPATRTCGAHEGVFELILTRKIVSSSPPDLLRARPWSSNPQTLVRISRIQPHGLSCGGCGSGPNLILEPDLEAR